MLALTMLFKEASQSLDLKMPSHTRVYRLGDRMFYKLRDIALLNDVPSYKLRYMFMDGQLDALFTLYQDQETRRYYVAFGPARPDEWPIRPFVYPLEEGGIHETR